MTQVLVQNKKSKALLNRAKSIVNLDEIMSPTRVIRRAVAAWKAHEYDDTQLLKDLTGNGLHAQLGSTAGVDAADPKHLPYKPWGVNPDGSVTLTEGTSARVLAPARANLLTQGDADIIITLQRDSWSVPGGTADMLGGWDSTSPQARGVFLYLATAGIVRMYWSVDGVNLAQDQTTIDVGTVLPTNRPIQLRGTLDVDNGAGGRTVKFYWAEVGSTVWTQLGADRITAGTTQIFAGAKTLAWGSQQAGGDYSNMRLFRALIKNGIDGPIVADFDAAKVKGPIYDDGLGSLWYGLGSAAWGDHLQVPGIVGNCAVAPNDPRLNVAGDIDVRALIEVASAHSGVIAAKMDSTTNGSYLIRYQSNSTFRFSFTTNEAGSETHDSPVYSSMFPVGTKVWIRATLDVNNGAAGHTARWWYSFDGANWTLWNETVTAGVVTLKTTTAPLAIGNWTMTPESGSLQLNGRVYRVQVFASLDGTDKRADVRFDKPLKWNNGQHTDPLGNVWTITRAALQSRLKVVSSSYIDQPGTVGNFIQTPDANELDVVGDIDLRVKVAMNDWTPSGVQALVGKYAGAGIMFRLATDGKPALFWTEADGVTSRNVPSTAATGLTDGSTKWLRVTLDVDNGAGQYEVKFFMSDDGVAWTQLGATVVGVTGVSSITTTAYDLNVGSRNGGAVEHLAGKIYEAQVWKGIPGVSASARLVANPKFTALTNYAPHKEPSYLALHGTGETDIATSPADPSLDITGDIEVIFGVAADDWSNGTSYVMTVRNSNAAVSYEARILNDKTISFRHSPTGSSSTVSASSVNPTSAADGQMKYFRITRDMDNGAGGNTTTFEEGDSATGPWTALGAPVVIAGTTAIADTNSALRIGSRVGGGAAEAFLGKVARLIIKNGIGGTTVFDADFTNLLDGQAAFTEVTGKTVTINGTARIERRTWSFTRAALNARAELRTGRYAYLPGVLGNHFQVDSETTPFQIASDFDIRACVGAVPVGGSEQWVFGRFRSTTTTRSYMLAITTGGTLRLYVSDGTTVHNATSSVVPGLTTSKVHIRATFDADDGAGNRVSTFYWSLDGVTWTLLDTITQAGAIVVHHTNTDRLVVGSNFLSTQNPTTGNVYSVELRDGINGTIVAAFDINDAMLMPVEPHNGFTDLYGNVWTVNRPAAGAKTAVVDRPVFWLDGVNDEFFIATNALTDIGAETSFTAILLFRKWGFPASHTQGFMGTKAASSTGNEGWILSVSGAGVTPTTRISDGVSMSTFTGGTMTSGLTTAYSMIRDAVNNLLQHLVPPAARISTPDVTTLPVPSNAIRIGRYGSASTFADMEFMGAAIFKEALTGAQISEVLAELDFANADNHVLV